MAGRVHANLTNPSGGFTQSTLERRGREYKLGQSVHVFQPELKDPLHGAGFWQLYIQRELPGNSVF